MADWSKEAKEGVGPERDIVTFVIAMLKTFDTHHCGNILEAGTDSSAIHSNVFVVEVRTCSCNMVHSSERSFHNVCPYGASLTVLRWVHFYADVPGSASIECPERKMV
jgi:hypothetical protein